MAYGIWHCSKPQTSPYNKKILRYMRQIYCDFILRGKKEKSSNST